jgi:hypothetical protein
MTGDIVSIMQDRMIDAEFREEGDMYYLRLHGLVLGDNKVHALFTEQTEIREKTKAETVDIMAMTKEDNYEAFLETGKEYNQEEQELFALLLASVFADYKVVFKYKIKDEDTKTDKGFLLFSKRIGEDGVERSKFESMVVREYKDMDPFNKPAGEGDTSDNLETDVITPSLLRTGVYAKGSHRDENSVIRSRTDATGEVVYSYVYYEGEVPFNSQHVQQLAKFYLGEIHG